MARPKKMHGVRTTTLKARGSDGAPYSVLKVEVPIRRALGLYELPQFRLEDGRLLKSTGNPGEFRVDPDALTLQLCEP